MKLLQATIVRVQLMRSVGTGAWIFEKLSVTSKYYREIAINKYTEIVGFLLVKDCAPWSYLGENRGEKIILHFFLNLTYAMKLYAGM
jgi:hypothetical protein